MPLFERYLSLWVALCIVVGIVLGRLLPGQFDALGDMEIARVNLPVAVLIWLMILPMLLKIDYHSLVEVKQHWKGVGVTLFINWGVKPFSMALLAWLFIRNLFAGWLPAAGCLASHARFYSPHLHPAGACRIIPVPAARAVAPGGPRAGHQHPHRADLCPRPCPPVSPCRHGSR